MTDVKAVAEGYDYVRALFQANPERARSTSTSTVRVDGRLRCEIEEGPWRLVADMPEKAGGSGEGPTPGVLGRAAFGSCVAICFVYEAARAGVEISRVEVDVVTDYDDGVMFRTSEGPAGYLRVGYRITVESEAPEEELHRVAEAAHAISPYVDVFGRALPIERSMEVVRRPR